MPCTGSLSISSEVIIPSGTWTSRGLIPCDILGVKINDNEAALITAIVCGQLAARYGQSSVPSETTFRSLWAAHSILESAATVSDIGNEGLTIAIELSPEEK